MAKNISVFYCFPRSGGTLLNQCLLCAPSNVVLSEVNPADCVFPVEKQTAEWFNLITEQEAEHLRGRPYLDKIEIVHQKTLEAGKRLCVRDWCGINFIDKISSFHGKPSGQLEQRLYLRHSGYTLHEIVLLRRSRAVYESLIQHIPELAGLSPDEFANIYHSYLERVSPLKKYHLETLIADKQKVLRDICSDLDLCYPPDFENLFHRIQTVTGNNTLPSAPASARWSSIRASVPVLHPSRAGSATQTKMFEELDELAGYHSPSP